MRDITIFVAALGDEERSEFAGRVDWAALLVNIRITNATILAIGHSLTNATRYGADQDAVRRALEGWIAANMDALCRLVRREYGAIRGSGGTQARRYTAVGVLLTGISEVSPAQAASLAASTGRSFRRSIDKDFADDESLQRLLTTLKVIALTEYARFPDLMTTSAAAGLISVLLDRHLPAVRANGGHPGAEPMVTAVYARRWNGSDVVVHLELVRGRAQADRVDLVGALLVDPRRDQVVGEDAAGGEELVVGLEGLEHRVERARHLLDVAPLLRRAGRTGPCRSGPAARSCS